MDSRSELYNLRYYLTELNRVLRRLLAALISELCWCLTQATLAAANVAARLQDLPVWGKPDVLPFVDGDFDAIPKASPSIVNAEDLKLSQTEQ